MGARVQTQRALRRASPTGRLRTEGCPRGPGPPPPFPEALPAPPPRTCPAESEATAGRLGGRGVLTVRSGPSGPAETGQEASQEGRAARRATLSALWPLGLPRAPGFVSHFAVLLPGSLLGPREAGSGWRRWQSVGRGTHLRLRPPWPTLQASWASAFNLGTLHLRTSPPFCCHQSPFTVYSDFRRDRKYPLGS